MSDMHLIQRTKKMCEYCEEGDGKLFISSRKLANDGLTYEGIEMTVENDHLYVFAVGNSARHYGVYGSYEKEILINYCPMCGRRL